MTIYFAYDELNKLFCVHVHDTGTGFCEGDLPKIFSRFGRLHRTTEYNNDGIGMGLEVCQKLVEKSGGTISAFSRGKDQGTVIEFTMKMKAIDEKETWADKT